MSRSSLFAKTLAAFGVAAVLYAGSASESSIRRVRDLGAPEQHVAYLLLDSRSGAVADSQWPDMLRPAPLGSLVKPFTALAYAQTHGYRYPVYDCRGESAGCWLPAGHGQVGVETAISHSCNVYFRRLAELVNYNALSAVAWRFGVAPPRPSTDSTSYVGLGDGWRAAPLAMARAYRELVLREAEPGIAPLLFGLRQSAEVGTASGVSRGTLGIPAWAKTGTAPCVHRPASNGDGYAVVIYPAPQPRYVLLIQKHGVPGRLAAVEAGKMIRRLERLVHR